MSLGRKIYTVYAGLTFFVTFLFLFPLFLLIIAIKPWRKFGYHINKIWAIFYFRIIFKKLEIEPHPDIDKDKVYIYCPNHFSYLDIPIMGFAPNNIIFVGKRELSKLPLFGFMFRKLHITVDRESKRGSYETYQQCKEMIQKGRSLVLFPEGGITSRCPPKMGRFKDGPFRIAIEQQIPVIPVTIPYNWIILPEKKKMLMEKGDLKVIFHQPIATSSLKVEDIKSLKDEVFDIIEKELKEHNNHES